MQTLNLNLKVSIVQTQIVAEHEERPTLQNNSDIAIVSAVLFRMLTASSAGLGVHVHACQQVHPICSHSSFRPFREASQCSASKRSFCSTLRTNSQGNNCSRRKRLAVQAVAYGEASETLAKGHKKYTNGDRMGALRLFEQCLSQDPGIEDRQAALFNSTCVHASFGDVEVAQVTLRDAINCGLDFEEAMRNPDYVKLSSSPQVIIQLRKFAQAAKRIKAAVGSEASAPKLAKAISKGEVKPGDLSEILSTDIRGGMDTSVLGIIRRVLLLILVGVTSGTALFFLGLKFAFPEYR